LIVKLDVLRGAEEVVETALAVSISSILVSDELVASSSSTLISLKNKQSIHSTTVQATPIARMPLYGVQAKYVNFACATLPSGSMLSSPDNRSRNKSTNGPLINIAMIMIV
jgi:hypothetical protein